MVKVQIPGSIKRFGTRYGKTIKAKVAFLEKDQRALHKCPKCHSIKVKRIVVGIWECGKCKNKFAGKAYNPGKKLKLVREVAPEEVVEKKVEAVEVEENKEVIVSE